MKKCAVYDLKDDKWNRIRNLPVKVKHAYSTKHMGNIYIVGDLVPEVIKFDLIKQEFTAIAI